MEGINVELTKMVETCNEGRIEFSQEVNQFSLDIHSLQAHLNKKVEGSDAQPLVDNEQLVEQKRKPNHSTIFV